MLNLHLLECTLKGYDHISDLLLAKYWVITGCKYFTCNSLTSVTIPDGVTKIGKMAFYVCYSLTSVYCKPSTPPIGGDYMFEINASGRKIYVPAGSVDAYKAADGWKSYASSIEPYEF